MLIFEKGLEGDSANHRDTGLITIATKLLSAFVPDLATPYACP